MTQQGSQSFEWVELELKAQCFQLGNMDILLNIHSASQFLDFKVRTWVPYQEHCLSD